MDSKKGGCSLGSSSME